MNDEEGIRIEISGFGDDYHITNHNVNHTIPHNKYPLELAIRAQSVPLLKMFLLLGADVNADNFLRYAVNYRFYEGFTILLETPGIIIDKQNEAGGTPLYGAIKQNNHIFIKQLIHHGARLENFVLECNVPNWIIDYQNNLDDCREACVLFMGYHEYVLPRKVGGLDKNVFKKIAQCIWSFRADWCETTLRSPYNRRKIRPN